MERVSEKLPRLARKSVEEIVAMVFASMGRALVSGDRVELRGFGTFAVKERPPRRARNPKTGAAVALDTRRNIAFIVGKELRQRLNAGAR